LHKLDNYIESPKETGYRGIHLVYKYNGDKEDYKDYFVEIQIRSKIQHAWATAVEIVDAFTKQALKSSKGQKDWLDFFTFVGNEFAALEKRPTGNNVEGVDTASETRRLAAKLSVEARLRAFTVSTDHIIQKGDSKTDYYLLELANNAKEIRITKYKQSQFEQATAAYLEREKIAKSSSQHDVVLVSASSMHALHKAYPNYFADSREFLRYLDRVLAIQTDLFA